MAVFQCWYVLVVSDQDDETGDDVTGVVTCDIAVGVVETVD